MILKQGDGRALPMMVTRAASFLSHATRMNSSARDSIRKSSVHRKCHGWARHFGHADQSAHGRDVQDGHQTVSGSERGRGQAAFDLLLDPVRMKPSLHHSLAYSREQEA